jgi:uncharacterized SAM-binding protein YcdF (DUF218 family)
VRGRARRWWRVGLLAMGAGGFAFVALAMTIAVYARESEDGPADAAVVLGAAVEDGRATPVFEERLRHAVDLYRRGRVRRLILTGGVGAGDVLAESEVARAYGLAHGVADGDMLLERESHSTRENFARARELMAAAGIGRVLVVSDPLHMRRAITLARDTGLDAHPSPTPTTRYVGLGARARFLLRETYFYARYLALRR